MSSNRITAAEMMKRLLSNGPNPDLALASFRKTLGYRSATSEDEPVSSGVLFPQRTPDHPSDPSEDPLRGILSQAMGGDTDGALKQALAYATTAGQSSAPRAPTWRDRMLAFAAGNPGRNGWSSAVASFARNALAQDQSYQQQLQAHQTNQAQRAQDFFENVLSDTRRQDALAAQARDDQRADERLELDRANSRAINDAREIGLALRESNLRNRSLPASVQKQEDSDLEDYQTAQNLNADLLAQKDALEGGYFKVDPLSRGLYMIQNATGNASPEASAFTTFQSTLEKMRNDSLRLNKGVQTEGDAVRAWNELFQAWGQNDTETVAKRLQEIAEINARAAKQIQDRINVRRSRNNADPFAWDELSPVTAVGGSKNQPSADDLLKKYGVQ